MSQATVALLGVGIAIIGLVITILSFSNTLRKAAIEEAVARGRMAQRMDGAEKGIDSAHEKIRKQGETVTSIDRTMIEIRESMKNLIAAFDELKTDVKSHLREG